MTLDPNAKKAAYDAALPALNRNAAPFHVIDLAIEAYLAASRSSAIVEEPIVADESIDHHAYRVAHIPEPSRSPQPHTGRAGVTDEMINAALNEKYGEVSIWSQLRVGVRSPFEIMRAALNAALTVEPEAPWQDIKTAPRDGTEFLAIWERSPPAYGVVWWEEGDWHEHDIETVVSSPTGWQPLPPARIRSAIAP